MRIEDTSEEEPEVAATVTQSAATLPELIATARRLSSTFLFYWTSSEAVYIWTLSSKGDVKAERVAVPLKRIEELAEQAAARSLDQRKEVYSELYRLLIKPWKHTLPVNRS